MEFDTEVYVPLNLSYPTNTCVLANWPNKCSLSPFKFIAYICLTPCTEVLF